MSQEEIFINGELLRLSREARGWVINDMATRACMSVKQIRQLEEGGMSAFYSAAVKATSAKKVGSLLGLSADQVFAQTVAPVEIEDAIEAEVLLEQAEPVSSEPEHVEPEAVKPNQAVETAIEAEHLVVKPEPESTPNSKNSLWMIAVLLAVALALGAYFQPQEEPVAAEPAPPIQVLPTDALDPASAASGADAVASSAEAAVVQASAPASVPVAPQKTASSVSAIVAPVAAPVVSTAVRSTSSAVANTPAASSAVKAP